MSEVTAKLTMKAKADTDQARSNIRNLGGAVIALNQAWELGARIARMFAGVVQATTGAALEQERVMTRLRNAVDSTGVSYEENSERLTAFIAEQQRFTRFGDDATAGAMTQIANLTAALRPSVTELEKLTELSQDVSERLGIDLAQSAQIVGRAFAGNVRGITAVLPGFRDYIRELNKIPDEAERGARGIDLLTEAFGGAATQLSPIDLALARVKNGLGDIQENIGDLLVQSPEMRRMMFGIAEAIDAISSATSGAATEFPALGNAIRNALDGVARTVLGIADAVITMVMTINEAKLSVEQTDRNRQRAAAESARDELNLLASGGGNSAVARAAASSRGALGLIPNWSAEMTRAATEAIESGDSARIEQAARFFGDFAESLNEGGRQEIVAMRDLSAEVAALRERIANPNMPSASVFTGEGGIWGFARGSASDLGTRGIPEDIAEGGGAGGDDAAAARVQQLSELYDSAWAEVQAQTQRLNDLATEAAESMASTVAIGAASMAESIAQSALESADALELLNQKMKQIALSATAARAEGIDMLKDGMTDLAFASVDAAVAAKNAGESVGPAVAKSSLQTLGRTASSLGQMFVLAAIGMAALPAFFGGNAVAAGVAGGALIALGAGLGVASGSMGGSGGRGSAAGSSDATTGVRDSRREREMSRVPTNVYDFAGVTIVSDSPAVFRQLSSGIQNIRALGGTSDVLLVGAR